MTPSFYSVTCSDFHKLKNEIVISANLIKNWFNNNSLEVETRFF